MMHCPKCGLDDPDERRTRCLVCDVPLERRLDATIGKLVEGRFLVDRLIGRGGMASVYRAEEVASGRLVAIKIMHDVEGLAEGRERFRREARHAAAIAHENVVEILGSGEIEGGPAYIVMELLEGRSLRDWLDGPMPIELVVSLGLQIARGLARAHDLGIVHRDLKPENVFVVERAGALTAKLVDFGIARARGDVHVTAYGALLGTPAYLAPERVRGKEASPSTDLYSLGIVLFEMITGVLPFESESREGYLFHHLETEPRRPRALSPSCPPALESLVLRLLAKSAAERPVDAHQVVRELMSLGAPTGFRESVPTLPSIQPPLRASLPEWMAAPLSSPSKMGFDASVRRALLLESLVRRVFAAEGIPEGLRQTLESLKAQVVVVDQLRGRRAEVQRRLDAIGERARGSREQVGRALHALGRDLSEARETLATLQAELARREAEAADLEFQIETLRRTLDEAEGARSGERLSVERELLDAGSGIGEAERVIAEATRTIVAALRERADGEALLRELLGG